MNQARMTFTIGGDPRRRETVPASDAARFEGLTAQYGGMVTWSDRVATWSGPDGSTVQVHAPTPDELVTRLSRALAIHTTTHG